DLRPRPRVRATCPHLAPSVLSPLSLHDALPICSCWAPAMIASRSELARPMARSISIDCSSLAGAHGDSGRSWVSVGGAVGGCARSEEHTSELQSRFDLVCRLLLEKKKDLGHADR